MLIFNVFQKIKDLFKVTESHNHTC